jgi:hypothetical protein
LDLDEGGRGKEGKQKKIGLIHSPLFIYNEFDLAIRGLRKEANATDSNRTMHK